MPKNALFLLKNRKNRRALGPQTPLPPAAGVFTPRPPTTAGFAPRPPLVSGSWGLRSHTPATASHDEFLAARPS